MDEYIGYFDVAMDNLVVIQINKSLKNVTNIGLRACFWKSLMFS